MRTEKQKSGKHKTVVGKLYATWCGHCVELEPVWKKMKKLRGIEFVEIEYDNITQGLEKLNARFKTDVKVNDGYPTIFKIERGKVEYYNGERTLPELTKWAKKTQTATRRRRNK
jgi:thiol-disulfide isomerase/thioredoxin